MEKQTSIVVGESKELELGSPSGDAPKSDVNSLKIILLGDSAVGKSKLMERYLMDDYCPNQDSTYALTLFHHKGNVTDKRSDKSKEVDIDFWDTAGQERFQKMHPSYYFGAHGCVLAFDVTRKATYKHLPEWLTELRQYAENIPVLCVANKIDVDMKVTQKAFSFPQKHGLAFSFCSAADGTNVVDIFEKITQMAYDYKEEGGDFMSEALALLDK